MPFYFKKGDLVEINCDAIINASNVNLKMVEGVGRAIFHKAGDKELSNACKQIGHCDVGKAVVTPSFNLKNAKAIIHAVAPIYINGKHGEEKALRQTYQSVFKIALENNYKTLAFPLLSGEFNYPLRECYEVGLDEIKKFLKSHDDFKIYMVLFKNFPEIVSEDTQAKISKFILDQYKVIFGSSSTSKSSNEEFVKLVKERQNALNISEDDLAFNSNYTPEELNQILTIKNDIPTKSVCYALAIGLKADEKLLKEMLLSLGYTSLNDDMSGLVTLYFLNLKIYDILKVNEVLFKYNVTPLGL